MIEACQYERVLSRGRAWIPSGGSVSNPLSSLFNRLFRHELTISSSGECCKGILRFNDNFVYRKRLLIILYCFLVQYKYYHNENKILKIGLAISPPGFSINSTPHNVMHHAIHIMP